MNCFLVYNYALEKYRLALSNFISLSSPNINTFCILYSQILNNKNQNNVSCVEFSGSNFNEVHIKIGNEVYLDN